MSMERAKFKERMKALKAYKNETGKGYWDWKVQAFDGGGTVQHLLSLGGYKGKTYAEIQEEMRTNDPESYDRLQANVARAEHPTSEIVLYKGANGNYQREQNLPVNQQSDVAEFLPGTGDIAELAEIGNQVKDGNYGTAAAMAGLAFLPGNLNALWKKGKSALAARSFKDIAFPIDFKSQDILSKKTIPANVKSQAENVSLAFYERPKSKLTEAEMAGVPKGQRNQPVKPAYYTRNNSKNSLYVGAAKDNRNLPFSEDDIAKADPQIAENMKYSNRQAELSFNEQYNQNFERALGDVQELDDFNLLLSDYIKGLPDADDMFLNANGLQSAYVQDYRKYLQNVGYDAASISDNDLAKLISQQYKDLTNSMTGKAKGMVMWHGSKDMFDAFDFSNTGLNTGNMGYGGPGNYFSNGRGLYGWQKDTGVLNIQPYLINNVQSTPSFTYMVDKKLLPSYISPNQVGSQEDYSEMIKRLIEDTPINDNKLYIDDISMPVQSTLTPANKYTTEYMLRRNTGIKSLFPHPSLFVRDANGTVQINRDWEDIRLNYKNGGVVPAYGDGTDGDDDPRAQIVNRANEVASNYDNAKDFDLSSVEYGLRKLAKNLFGRGGISNCTLSATGWIDPNNQYMSARNIFNNPNSGYVEIDKEYALPGDLLISKNPEKDSYHTMLIEGFNNNEPLLRYSRGGHDTEENLVKGRPLTEYHRLDNEQGGNHTEDHYFRYTLPNEFWLPEITITAPRKITNK